LPPAACAHQAPCRVRTTRSPTSEPSNTSSSSRPSSQSRSCSRTTGSTRATSARRLRSPRRRARGDADEANQHRRPARNRGRARRGPGQNGGRGPGGRATTAPRPTAPGGRRREDQSERWQGHINLRLGAVMSREQAQVYLRPIPCIGQHYVVPECATSCCEWSLSRCSARHRGHSPVTHQ
jgi:hypothetical protein